MPFFISSDIGCARGTQGEPHVGAAGNDEIQYGALVDSKGSTTTHILGSLVTSFTPSKETEESMYVCPEAYVEPPCRGEPEKYLRPIWSCAVQRTRLVVGYNSAEMA